MGSLGGSCRHGDDARDEPALGRWPAASRPTGAAAAEDPRDRIIDVQIIDEPDTRRP